MITAGAHFSTRHFHTWINPLKLWNSTHSGARDATAFSEILRWCLQHAARGGEGEKANVGTWCASSYSLLENCEIYGTKRTETFSKCDWNVFYEPLTASMGSNVNPFSPLNFLALLMVINSVFIVSGAAGFSIEPLQSERNKTRKRKSDIIIIKIENRDTHCRELHARARAWGGRKKSFF